MKQHAGIYQKFWESIKNTYTKRDPDIEGKSIILKKLHMKQSPERGRRESRLGTLVQSKFSAFEQNTNCECNSKLMTKAQLALTTLLKVLFLGIHTRIIRTKSTIFMLKFAIDAMQQIQEHNVKRV